MHTASVPDTTSSIEDAVRILRAVAQLLTVGPVSADDLLEEALKEALLDSALNEPDAVQVPILYYYLRLGMVSAEDQNRDTITLTPPFDLREAYLLHYVAAMSTRFIAGLLGEHHHVIQQRIEDASDWYFRHGRIPPQASCAA